MGVLLGAVAHIALHLLQDGSTALAAAAFGGHSGIVTFLLQRGADVNAVNEAVSLLRLFVWAHSRRHPLPPSLRTERFYARHRRRVHVERQLSALVA